MSQAPDHRHATPRADGRSLPPGTRIRDYEIRGVLAAAWGGTVHLAFDHALQRLVALEDWLPDGLATRVADGPDVRPVEGHEDAFSAGLLAFVGESRLLARFDHAGLLRVWRFWEEHGTAWRVTPVLEGPTLAEALAAHGRPSTEAEARSWLAPLLDALALLHAAGATHGALDPERLVLLPGGPVLLGPDAGRRAALAAAGDPDAALVPGCAAPEQYAGSAAPPAGPSPAASVTPRFGPAIGPTLGPVIGPAIGPAIGPWTDLYAVGALLHRAFLGALPPPAPQRLAGDPMEPLATRTLDGVSETMLAAVDAALAVRPEQRPRHHAELRGLVGELDSVRSAPVLVPRDDPMEEPFAGAVLRAEEITIPDVPLVERSGPLAEAAAASRPTPLADAPAADGAAGRRSAPIPLESLRSAASPAPSARSAATARPNPGMPPTGPAPLAAAFERPRTGTARRGALLVAAVAVVAVVLWLIAAPFLRGPAGAAAARASASPPAAPAATAAATPAPSASPSMVPIAAAASAIPVAGEASAPNVAPPSASPVSAPAAPNPVGGGLSVPVPGAASAAPPASAPAGDRATRCTEILQKASLEGIGAADAEYYKKECR